MKEWEERCIGCPIVDLYYFNPYISQGRVPTAQTSCEKIFSFQYWSLEKQLTTPALKEKTI